MDFSVVLPCYNEAGNLKTILDRFRRLSAQKKFELILVDNGSTDGTREFLAVELSRPENSFARLVRVHRNIGYGHGLMAGLRETRAAVLAFSHADLQCPPEDLLRAFSILTERTGDCLVKGRRRGGRPLLDRIVTWFYNRFSHTLLGLTVDGGGRAPDVNAEPKMFGRALLADLEHAPVDFTFDLFVLNAARRRKIPIVEFDVAYESRAWGKSKLAANPWVRLKTSMKAFLKIWELRQKN